MEHTEVIFGLPGVPSCLPMTPARFAHTPRARAPRTGRRAHGRGYADVTGRPGVAMVTSGPGATNLVTPLCDAYMDSVPMVAITGQVARPIIGTDAFQEGDTVGITRSVTKHNELVMRAEDIALSVRQAFLLATTGRPGPVLLDIPKDILQAQTEWYWPNDDEVAASLPGYRPTPKATPHGEGGGTADNRLAAAGNLCRRRDLEGPGLRGPHETGRAYKCARRDHLDGSGAFLTATASAGDAGHARQLHSNYGHAGGGPAHSSGYPF